MSSYLTQEQWRTLIKHTISNITEYCLEQRKISTLLNHVSPKPKMVGPIIKTNIFNVVDWNQVFPDISTVKTTKSQSVEAHLNFLLSNVNQINEIISFTIKPTKKIIILPLDKANSMTHSYTEECKKICKSGFNTEISKSYRISYIVENVNSLHKESNYTSDVGYGILEFTLYARINESHSEIHEKFNINEHYIDDSQDACNVTIDFPLGNDTAWLKPFKEPLRRKPRTYSMAEEKLNSMAMNDAISILNSDEKKAIGHKFIEKKNPVYIKAQTSPTNKAVTSSFEKSTLFPKSKFSHYIKALDKAIPNKPIKAEYKDMEEVLSSYDDNDKTGLESILYFPNNFKIEYEALISLVRHFK